MTEHIHNSENCTLEIINGVLMLTPTNVFISEEEFQKNDFLNDSIILQCEIKNNEEIVSKKTTYMGLLIDVWKTMSNQRVIQTTKFKFSLKDENENNMLVWYEEINMYVATKDANNTFKELLNMIKINNYSIKISIKLKEGRVIQFKT
jgi:hypothetical protein